MRLGARKIRGTMMHAEALFRRLLAEGLGSALLAATVVGSGIMGERLSGGNVAVALLANTGATVAVLAALIALLGPLSGAHLNPAVSVIQALRSRLSWGDAALYSLVQIGGCCLGALLAHVMFELPVWQAAAHVRTGPAQWLAEGVATFGLLLIVASTSFANPAITIARSLTNTFSGIRAVDVPGFILAQLIGALAALAVARVLFPVKVVTTAVSDNPSAVGQTAGGKAGALNV